MRTNKTQKVMQHLQTYGRINTWQAIKEYNATRLSSIIYNLRRRYNMLIVNEREDFVDCYGDKSHYDNYVLVKQLDN